MFGPTLLTKYCSICKAKQNNEKTHCQSYPCPQAVEHVVPTAPLGRCKDLTHDCFAHAWVVITGGFAASEFREKTAIPDTFIQVTPSVVFCGNPFAPVFLILRQ